MSELKEYCRSVRVTPTVQGYVEKQAGKGFNQKFESMVLYCMAREPELKKSIAEKERQLRELNKRILEANSLLNDLDIIKGQLSSVVGRTTAIVQRIEEKDNDGQVTLEQCLQNASIKNQQ